MSKFAPLDLSGLKSGSIYDRHSKVSRKDFARPWEKGGGLSDFLDRLPGILAAADFKEISARLAEVVKGKHTLMLAMGGHPVKVGLSPIIIDLMKRGVISLLAVNGSVMVHDVEVALAGSTSEDVAAALGSGEFGMSKEANKLINGAAVEASQNDLGLGRALGKALRREGGLYLSDSLFAQAYELDIPVTVHVALGTDVYHIHPEADGAAIGQASLRDFRTFCAAAATLDNGAYVNLGSAVIMPEVFLKAVTLARNLGRRLDNLTTVNMDFIRQYRPQVNVVERPTAGTGRGFNLTGHHELMFPLLAAALIERL